MKTIKAILLLATVIILAACEGPQGVPGPPGEPGVNILGTVFEIEGDFTPDNDYLLYYEFRNDFQVYDSDVVLVYILWEMSNGIDVWRLMPQTVVLKTISDQWSDTDVLQYNFDYTYNDVQIFLEGTMDFSTLLPGETDNQVFRIVVLPADFIANKSIDISDFNSLIESPQLEINSFDEVTTIIK
jgi:hypothetical protein